MSMTFICSLPKHLTALQEIFFFANPLWGTSGTNELQNCHPTVLVWCESVSCVGNGWQIISAQKEKV